MVEDVFELNKVVNQDIVGIIDVYQLNTKSRKREKAYMRYYLYNVLKSRRYLTHSMIGKFFNRDHSSVTLGL
jgi:chromosomal replication initiation ATPase DnaA